MGSLPSVGARLSRMPSCSIKLGECKTSPTLPTPTQIHTSTVTATSSAGSIWRLPQYTGNSGAVWPNYVNTYVHRKHRAQQHWHTWGIFKTTKMNVVDNSALEGKQWQKEDLPRLLKSTLASI